jgi:hypothetical protein
MRSARVVALCLLLSPLALSQTSVNTAPPAAQAQPPAAQAQQPPSYANYSIMLVGPPGGSAVVLMHNPKNELEFVEVHNTKQALSAGYVAVRAAELGEFISALKETNARLAAENERFQQSEQARQVAAVPASPTTSQAELAAQARAQIEAQNAARRQQLIQTWMTLQNMNRPQTQNLNVTISDCTRLPALCAGK